jgi:hypothetical protein
MPDTGRVEQSKRPPQQLGSNIGTAGGADVEGMEDMEVMEWSEQAMKETSLPAEMDGEGAWVMEGGNHRRATTHNTLLHSGFAYVFPARM